MTLNELRSTEAFKYETWFIKAIGYKKDFYMFCEVCYHFMNRDIKTEETQDDIGHLIYTLEKRSRSVDKKLRDKGDKPPLFKRKLLQWRVMFLFERIVDVIPEALESNNMALYLNYKWAGKTTSFQLTKLGKPPPYVYENVPDDQLTDIPALTADVIGGKVRCLRVYKTRVHFFFTEIAFIDDFLQNHEIEFRITIG